MAQYIDKSAVMAEIERRIKEIEEIGTYLSPKGVLTNLLCHLDTLEVQQVDLKQKSFVKIDRKLLFEICDAILNHYGYSDVNDCPDNDSECFWGKWDEGFRKKVENIRRNS